MWPASGGGSGRQAIGRASHGWKAPDYFNLQEPLYVGCAKPSSASVAPLEEDPDGSDPEEDTAGKPLGQAVHALGDCSPCAYFWQKADGCRLGDECQYCHLCDRDAIRRWKKAKKQRKKADAIRNAPTTRSMSYKKKPVGVVNTPKKSVGVVNTSNNPFPAAAIEPARVNLAVSVQSASTGIPPIGMSRPYLSLDVLAGPPGLGFDFSAAPEKLGFGELLLDDKCACFAQAKQSFDDVDSNCQSILQASTGYTASTINSSFSMDAHSTPNSFVMKASDGQVSARSSAKSVLFGTFWPYLEQRLPVTPSTSSPAWKEFDVESLSPELRLGHDGQVV